MNKRALLTGGNRGIGLPTATGLVQAGFDLTLLVRDRARGDAAADEIATAAGRRPDILVGNLAEFATVRAAAAAYAAQHDGLELLVHNAGIYATTFERSNDGFGRTLATNHLGPFLLTQLLLPLLRAAAPSRIVWVASEAHRGKRIDIARVEHTRAFDEKNAYGQSKLANILTSNEFARRLAGSGVTSNALHPGVIATGLLANYFRGAAWPLRVLRPALGLFFVSPKKGARTTLHVATAAELATTTGAYFKNCCVSRASVAAREEAQARRLFDLSASWTC